MPEDAASREKRCALCNEANPATAIYCRRCGKAWNEPVLYVAMPRSALMLHWRRLRRQMTRREVRRLLGEPSHITVTSAAEPRMERWLYEYERDRCPRAGPSLSGFIEFELPDGVTAGWTEPDWSSVSADTSTPQDG